MVRNSNRRELPAVSHPIRWFPEFLSLSKRRVRSQARLLGMSLVVGVVAGVGAIGFYAACKAVSYAALESFAGYQPAEPGGEVPLFAAAPTAFQPWLLPIVAALGGLLSGWLVYTFAPEAEGHGTDSAIAAYHHRQGFIRPRVPLIKIVSSALTISTGGSGGREGPIALIGAGFGSFLGGILKMRPAERRVLMAAGMGAGVAAIFHAPLAGALFAAEVLYASPDFESEVIMPAALASVVAYCTFALAFGWEPLFTLSPAQLEALSFNSVWELIPYTLLALCCVLSAMLFTRSFYGLTHQFHRLGFKPHLKPAVGALLSALVGLALYYAFGRDPQVLAVLGAGYGILQTGLTLTPGEAGNLTLAALLLAVAVGKICTTGLTIGSGGSAGVFGPSMVIGGCGGGALGVALHHLWPALVPHPSTFVVVGMAGFFAAAAKTPFSTIVMVGELTGGYDLLLPTLWVCVLSFLLSDEQSIYSAQVLSRTRSPAHQAEFVRGMLGDLTVGQFQTPIDVAACLRADSPLERIRDRLALNPQGVAPVVDEQGGLLGVVGIEEAFAAMRVVAASSLIVAADVMRAKCSTLLPTDSVDRAMELFVVENLLELPVVGDPATRTLTATVRRAAIAGAYLQHVQGMSAAEGVAENDPS